MKTIQIILLIAILTGCKSEEQKKATRIVADLWDVQNISVGSLSSTDAKEGSGKAIVLTLEDLKGVDTNYPKDFITSMSAYNYINNLPEEEYKDFDNIKVIVKNQSKLNEKIYRISNILIAKDMIKQAEVFSKKIISGNLKDFEGLFDRKNIPDSTITKIKNVISENIAKEGKQDKATIMGFDFGRLNETNEPAMVAYIETSNAKSYSTYKLMMRVADKKIVYLGINEN